MKIEKLCKKAAAAEAVLNKTVHLGLGPADERAKTLLRNWRALPEKLRPAFRHQLEQTVARGMGAVRRARERLEKLREEGTRRGVPME